MREQGGPQRWRAALALGLALTLALSGGCLSSEEGGQFYGRVSAPRAQELRWSDGGLPRIFDPARAASPPDTDAVRALYDGLTDYDPLTLSPVSADAYRWDSSTDSRIWTFYLRSDARWSNGDPVTARDYLRSWQRTLSLGDDAPHADLLSNLIEVAGDQHATREARESSGKSDADRNDKSQATEEQATDKSTGGAAKMQMRSDAGEVDKREQRAARATIAAPRLSVEAVDDHTLRVHLRRPDPNLPVLLAHTIFRPVHTSMLADELKSGELPEPAPSRKSEPHRREQIVTNGAFRLSETTDEGVVLEREPGYRDAANVALEKVHFVNERDAESALREYRDGKIDAVTNVNVEPAGLKLLASYQDFKRTTFGALTYYDFNSARPPFDDVRVRESFALALDRKRLSEDTLGGSTVPAEKYLPTQSSMENGNPGSADASKSGPALGYDPIRARRLLAEAGYPGGDGFPRIRLLVNRNEQHRQVAETVAEMWHDVLGVETVIETKSWDEYETRLRAGEYDVAKRSLLMQTPDEEQNLAALFSPDRFAFGAGEVAATSSSSTTHTEKDDKHTNDAEARRPSATSRAPELLNEAQALKEVPAIPIYFASSFTLVKPYVQNFGNNLLGIYSLKRVRIDTDWHPPASEAGKASIVGR
ncbi:MAG: oligopeptide transport system substrate-binding protein [Acidobacteriota bacterium]|nr:oligopeptide transport system substrate-binding protein [Acidobacteriota bacterium]